MSNPHARTFTILSTSIADPELQKYNGGRFVSASPLRAAKKAYNTLCRRFYKRDGVAVCHIDFVLEETTEGSAKKGRLSCYSGKRVYLKKSNRVTISRGGKEFAPKFQSKVKYIPQPSQIAVDELVSEVVDNMLKKKKARRKA